MELVYLHTLVFVLLVELALIVIQFVCGVIIYTYKLSD